MGIGSTLLWLAIIPILSGIWFSIKYIKTSIEKYKNYAKISSYLTASFLTISFLIFAYYCLTASPQTYYSFYYSMPSFPWFYKLSAIWAGKKGSVFLWMSLLVISFIVAEYVFSKKSRKTQEMWDLGRPLTLVIIALFLGILILSEPFISVPSQLYALEQIPRKIPLNVLMNQYNLNSFRGAGMNSQLLNPWMVVHPPVLFVGYATFTLPMIASLVYGITGRKDWFKLSEIWSRIGWLFLSLGIAIGALWAYVTLGWGGYWAWDPVENASLLPWLTGTAFLHLQSRYKKTKEYKYLAHFFSITTFSLVIFATLITRGGITLVGSTHAYPTALPTLRSFLYMVLIIGPLVLGGLILWKRYQKEK